MPFVRPSTLRRLGVLGMNERNVEVIGRWNSRKSYPVVDNKLKTKMAAQDAGVAVPELLGVVSHQHEVKDLRKVLGMNREFVIKPAQGSGGKGILVITGRERGRYLKPSGTKLSLLDLQRDVSNILSGLYSLGGRQDVAMIETLVRFDEQLAQYSYEGVPDIRVVVYRGYPVMAMMRCSTHASDGKANLHQGAVGVGIDLAEGRSLYAVQNSRLVTAHPDTGQGFDALRLPHWQTILDLSAGCYEMTGLGYLGVDIVIDKLRGPLILELNARPGLAIQVANQQGMAARLAQIDQAFDSAHSVRERVSLSCELFGQAPSTRSS